MNIIIIVVAVTAGVILGGTAMYVYQEKCRQKELKLLAECMEKILREEKIRETKAGEETPLTIVIKKEDWKKAVAGQYSDTVTFTISYVDKSE